MSRSDFYASWFGAFYSAYMERPRLARRISRLVWGGDLDLFLSFWGMHCFPDPAAAIAEAARVLVRGGRLVGCTFVRGTDGLRQRLLIRPGLGDFGAVATASEIERHLGSASLTIDRLQRAGPMLYFTAHR